MLRSFFEKKYFLRWLKPELYLIRDGTYPVLSNFFPPLYYLPFHYRALCIRAIMRVDNSTDEFMEQAFRKPKRGSLKDAFLSARCWLLMVKLLLGTQPTGATGQHCLRAEIDCLENAVALNPEIISGRYGIRPFRRAICAAASPCWTKSPELLQVKIQNFRGPEDYPRLRGVELVVLNTMECIEMMRNFHHRFAGGVEQRYRGRVRRYKRLYSQAKGFLMRTGQSRSPTILLRITEKRRFIQEHSSRRSLQVLSS